MAMAGGDTDANEFIVDDKIDEVLLNLVLQKKLEVSTVIKVYGIPKVTPIAFNQLRVDVTKIFTQYGKILRDYYPKSENGHTKGFLFIEYEDPESTLKAVKGANDSQLDSKYPFLVQLVSNCKRIATLLQPIPGHNVQYHVDKYLYNRIQDWMNNVPHIPELEKRKMMAEAQLAMAKKNDS
ncbi:eukaryotic translation initiation factor 3 subunit B-like isoform X1 [Myzus persicae]|uniref:eukaryotic translation initiation factor 3 subunit B-like isoform X1 n=1 Tax=Myzus persicae TaxID=13164 RepID=UPI000B9364C6|nr:eukaryotic translation initiation factor 3 subunit B-like isoform X1 [Myzus persicae]XP_022176173.1 eukaryotic translation initiation factor 3 subunit B-like isoform X1 [Myzus persicae]XP_022176174.1 eukaryotic translation initiation factor 3 subunit B-like isoform X1 [Myzus persicae]XP_022176175.1 eukaryotic translation initiation factor 3 subunit B-like isoform X1 [Myzus persicae]